MIDTLILQIPREKTKDIKTSGSGWVLQSQDKGYMKIRKNFKLGQGEEGYYPRLTGIQRGNTKSIKIEFSVPKLIFKDNLNELSENQFDDVIKQLHKCLLDMGLQIDREYLKQAPVQSVHYSRNVELKDGYSSSYVISELNKINLNKHFDLTRSNFKNDGQSLNAYTESHSFVVYDKVADLNSRNKRSMDRDQTDKQKSLFPKLNKKKEIIRLEARLCHKRKMNSLFEKLGFSRNPTFRDVFSENKSNAILMNYWNQIIKPNSLILFSSRTGPKNTLKKIMNIERKIQPKTAINFTGLLLLSQDGNGLRELRTILFNQSSDRTWYRIVNDCKIIQEALSESDVASWFSRIESSIKTYNPYLLSVDKLLGCKEK
jgi:uncharacterized protein YggL (DUF469 family)